MINTRSGVFCWVALTKDGREPNLGSGELASYFPDNAFRTSPAPQSGNGPNAVEARSSGRVGQAVGKVLARGSGGGREIGAGIIPKTREQIGRKFELIFLPGH